MEISSIIDILFIIGAIALGFLPGVKKMLGEEKTAKKVVRPVFQETEDDQEEVRPKERKAKVTSSQSEQSNEYFSYETMNERDFEMEFNQNSEESVENVVTETSNKGVHLSFDE